MKKVLLMALCIALSVILVACAVGSEEVVVTNTTAAAKPTTTKPTETIKPTTTEKPKVAGMFESDGYTAKYLSAEIVKDYNKKDALKLVFEYTNTGSKSEAPIYNVAVKAFQGGIELETAYVMDDPDTSLTDRMSEIKPGVIINIAEYFLLKDTSDVEVEVSDWISLDENDKTVIIITLN